jgi:hypothetical protein
MSGVVVVSRCGELLAGPVRAEPPADRAGQQHQHAERQGGQHPQPGQRAAGGQRRQPGQERGQRGLVHVPERQMLPGGQEVQLVAVIPVPRADRQLHRDR